MVSDGTTVPVSATTVASSGKSREMVGAADEGGDGALVSAASLRRHWGVQGGSRVGGDALGVPVRANIGVVWKGAAGSGVGFTCAVCVGAFVQQQVSSDGMGEALCQCEGTSNVHRRTQEFGGCLPELRSPLDACHKGVCALLTDSEYCVMM